MQNRGFTLLELVITVIIIAVLAALAVSAYQKAVLKSRFSSVIPPTKTIANAQELYYMNEGSYATNIRNLDIKLNDDDNTITLNDKKNYQYVMGTANGAANNHYIVYQSHSKRFANDIHCEAQKDDALANWLCEKGLGGTLLTGSINGSNWSTYLLSGEGKGKFLRTDCPYTYYDEEGVCTKARNGYYAEDGEEKPCPMGTWGVNGWCQACAAGQYADTTGNTSCTPCPNGTTSNVTGATSVDSCTPGPAGKQCYNGRCYACQAGTYSTGGASSCTPCPNGTTSNVTGATSVDSCTPCPAGQWGLNGWCQACQAGTYSGAGASSCTKCPSGTTSNSDHTACI